MFSGAQLAALVKSGAFGVKKKEQISDGANPAACSLFISSAALKAIANVPMEDSEFISSVLEHLKKRNAVANYKGSRGPPNHPKNTKYLIIESWVEDREVTVETLRVLFGEPTGRCFFSQSVFNFHVF